MEWIEVTNRLPENGADVIVTALCGILGRRVLFGKYGTGFTNDEIPEFVEWSDYCEDWLPIDCVIAWMPYPEPYYDND